MIDWTTSIHALFPHPSQSLVLVRDSDLGKITLPSKIHNGRIWVSETLVLKPLFEELTGVPINILRYVAYHRDAEAHQIHCIYLLEPRTRTFPQTALWQPLEKILVDSDLPSALQEGLKRWEVEQRSGVIPERRAPWANAGWHAEVEGWIEEQVLNLGRGAVQSFEPIKSWSISCVLKVITKTGSLYFKVPRDLPLFVNEAVVLSRLAELYPDRVPNPVALDPEKGWMLLDDFGNQPDGDAPLNYQVSLMQDFARVQLDSSRRVETLIEIGCKDRRLANMHSQIHALFEDELVLQLLTQEERGELQSIASRLPALMTELSALPVPAALMHGDLHAGNVIQHKNSFLYFDWTDAAISHPYFDMIHIFMEEDETRRNVLQEAYLSVWEEHFSKADVRRAWELAGALFGLYHAISYQYIVHGIEELVQVELNFAYYFLRKLLAGIRQLDAK